MTGLIALLIINAPQATLTTLPDRVVITQGMRRITLTPLAERAIRVQAVADLAAMSPSFILQTPTSNPKFRVSKEAGQYVIATSKIQAVFDVSTGAIKFLDRAGKPFLSERPGTRYIRPNSLQGKPLYSVGQTFDSPASEHLFGLGQFQDGLWDWRGLPIELRQLNTQSAVPVLVSSRGYGVLWGNASRTDFNLPDSEIKLSGDVPNPANGPTATEQLRGNPGTRQRRAEVHGTFTPGQAATYAFVTREGDRRGEITISVNGKPINSIVNMWTPRALAGKITLPANRAVKLSVRGGGPNVKLFVRRADETTTFRSDYGEGIDYTVYYGPKLDDVIATYRSTTGAAPLWPKWAYGFWQCRERYSSQAQILAAANEFRARKIPLDLIIQDWQYWGNHGWGSYQWDLGAYPNPRDMIAKLHENDVRFMISVWCNPSGTTHQELVENGATLGSWIDVFGMKGRDIRWKHLNEAFFSIGTDAWWGDATEPGDPGTEILDASTALGPGAQVTSAYPLFASQSIYDGQRKADSRKRVCILTRCAFPGMQRYGAAAWSGDIASNWDAMRRQIPAGLNFSLAGIPYWTTDTGGFFRPRDQYTSPDFNELLVRWFEWSTFSPILRVHGYQSATEMWNYLPETQKYLIAFDELRYRMLPYNYSVAWKVTSEGASFMRPLGMDFPEESQAWGVSDAYMFGPSLYVAPVTEPGATKRTVFVPKTKGGWYDFWSGNHVDGGASVDLPAPLSQIPVLARAGAILPLGPVLQSANQFSDEPLDLRVYPGANGSFTLYDDAGDGYDYENGQRSLIPLKWDDTKKIFSIGARLGSYPHMQQNRRFRIELVGGKALHDVSYTGRPVSIKL